MTIEQEQQECAEHLSQLDWFDKYDVFLRIAGDMPGIPEEKKSKENRVSGCQTNTWLLPDIKNGKLHFTVDSDAMIVKGMLGMMAEILSGRYPDEILGSTWFLWDSMGISDEMGESRSKGMMAAYDMIRKIAAESK